MGWLDSIGSAISGVGSFLNQNKWVGQLASTVVTGFALNKVSKSIASSSDKASAGSAANKINATDYGQMIQVNASQDFKVPVLYGTAIVAGAITEANMSDDRQTMTYVLTIAEKTGFTNLGVGADSTYILNKVYWGGSEMTFQSDGVTAASTIDPDGNSDPNINGLVTVRFYAGSTAMLAQRAPSGYSVLPTPAYSIVPNWDSFYTMEGYIFAVVTIAYNKTNGVTGLPNVTFNITNSMSQPGDCLYDYMTNTRYGAGILSEDMYL